MSDPSATAEQASAPAALDAIKRSIQAALPLGSVARLIAEDQLHARLQPIARLGDGAVVAYEALIRGPEGSPLHLPVPLFAAAQAEGLSHPLQWACVRTCLRAFGAAPPAAREGPARRVFVNLTASALLAIVERFGIERAMRELEASGLAPGSVVVELTEHERVTDLPAMVAAVDQFHRRGVRFALDDFGDGHSSLRLWAELRPEFVKIDKYFVSGVDRDATKVQVLRGLMRFAEIFGTTMVAEGVETAEELRTVREIGIDLAQGYLIGRPGVDIAAAILPAAADVIGSREVAVLPQIQRGSRADFSVERLASAAPGLSPSTSVDAVAQAFAADTTRRAIALVEDGRPIGLIHREGFVDRYARPYFREIFGRRPCVELANRAPLLLDRRAGLDSLTEVLTSPDQRYLTEGFIVTDNGRYHGLGTGEQLVRVVTEARIEAARHANPLTYLPGNIPISEHIRRLIDAGAPFVACYGDLNEFKPFNDRYGYWRGDEMIRLAAKCFAAECEPARDFLGHVGGDDFVAVFQSADWMERCRRVVEVFNRAAESLYDDADRASGGIEAEDRHGQRRRYGFTTLSIGAVAVAAAEGRFDTPEAVASAAARAKQHAKQARLPLAFGEPDRAVQ